MFKHITVTAALSAALLAACATPEASAPTEPLPASLDRERLMSSAPEPEGPGTQLGSFSDVSIVAAPGLPTHTLYYPVTNTADPLPVLVWGNGACTNAGRLFEKTLKKVASHGYAVVAVGPFEPATDKTRTTGSQMVDAIDWLETSPKLPGSVSRTLDASNIAVMGQSCGGLMTIEAASDPRIDTIGVINSGTFPKGEQPMSMSTTDKETLTDIHTPRSTSMAGQQTSRLKIPKMITTASKAFRSSTAQWKAQATSLRTNTQMAGASPKSSPHG